MTDSDWPTTRTAAIILGVFCVFWFSFIIWTGTNRPGRDTSCQDRCFPYASATINDVCHCATQNGYKRADEAGRKDAGTGQ